jgi:hypothetical protein
MLIFDLPYDVLNIIYKKFDMNDKSSFCQINEKIYNLFSYKLVQEIPKNKTTITHILYDPSYTYRIPMHITNYMITLMKEELGADTTITSVSDSLEFAETI